MPLGLVEAGHRDRMFLVDELLETEESYVLQSSGLVGLSWKVFQHTSIR